MWAWLKNMFRFPGDLEAGQIVHVEGVGEVVVTDPWPFGATENGMFYGTRADGQEGVYLRHEILR